MSEDEAKRMDALERRVWVLEEVVSALQRVVFPRKTVDPSPTYPGQTARGCVCPAGTEMACGSVSCPRRSHYWR